MRVGRCRIFTLILFVASDCSERIIAVFQDSGDITFDWGIEMARHMDILSNNHGFEPGDCPGGLDEMWSSKKRPLRLSGRFQELFATSLSGVNVYQPCDGHQTIAGGKAGERGLAVYGYVCLKSVITKPDPHAFQ